ncbi:MAG TPA: helix-turn-helix domain-containing protein [Gemmatimonadaceae bacterium]|nr:helix-turn-helix domain-containing protein [Gemmatimonadaceae bacterium]
MRESLDAGVDGAKLIDETLVDLETVVNGAGTETLTIAEAAARSGYSQDHIRRLIRNGTIPNVGKRRAPRVLATDLPRKPGVQVAGASGEKYSHFRRSIPSRAGG